jgi:hypothetical protein
MREGIALFSGSTQRNPSEGIPKREEFHDCLVRLACERARRAAGLQPADAVELTGRKRAAAGRYMEWERGQRPQTAAWISEFCTALGIGPDEIAGLRDGEELEFRAALTRWESQPMAPLLVIDTSRSAGVEHWPPCSYNVPEGVPAEDDAIIEWAMRCCALAWRPGVLWLRRSMRIQIDGEGQIVD